VSEETASPPSSAKTARDPRSRLATVFGWLAGGTLGLLANYGLFVAIGEGYPTTYTTFGLFLMGAFGGMALADRLGAKGFKVLAVAAGVLLALLATVVVASFMASNA
jgi:hypothetical protein